MNPPEEHDLILASICRPVIKYMPAICSVFLLVQVCNQGFYPLMVTTADLLRSEPRLNEVAQIIYGVSLKSAELHFPKNDVRTATALYDLANLQLHGQAPRDARVTVAGEDSEIDGPGGALAHARAALNMCTAMFGVSSRPTNQCQSLVAAILRAKGDSPGALKSEQRVLTTCRELYGDTHVSVANELEDIATHHRENGNLDLAVMYQNQSLKVRQKLWGADSRYTVQDLIEVGDAYTKLGAPQRAIELYLQALEITQKQPDKAGDQTPAIRQKIADWFYEHQDYEKALLWYKSELVGHTASKDVAYKDHYLPRDQELVGRCLVRLGRYAEGIKELEGAQRLYNKLYGQRSEYAARVYQWLAKAHEGAGELAKAEDAIRDAVSIYDETVTDKTDNVFIPGADNDGYDELTAHCIEANLLVKMGKAAGLIERLQKQIKVEEGDITRSRLLQLLYTVQARAGHFHEAAQTHDRYIDSLIPLRTDATGNKSIRDFRAWCVIGQQRFAKQDVPGAIDAVRKAARLGEQLSELEDRELVECFQAMAAAELRVGKYSEAEQHLEKARKLAEQDYLRTNKRVDTAYTLAKVEWLIAADYLMTVDRCQDALSHFKRALDILRTLDAHPRDLFVCLRDYAACLRITGNVAPAVKAEREAADLNQDIVYDIHRAGECVAMHSGEGTFRLEPSSHALELILQEPLDLREALYAKTTGDEARARGHTLRARAEYEKALRYLEVLQLEESPYAVPIKRDLAALEQQKSAQKKKKPN